MRRDLSRRVHRVEEARLRAYAYRLQRMTEEELTAELAQHDRDPALSAFLDSLTQRELHVLAATGNLALARLMTEERDPHGTQTAQRIEIHF